MKEVWIKEVNGYVVDVLSNYTLGIEQLHYRKVKISDCFVSMNVATGYYLYDEKNQTFILDEDKVFADFLALKKQKETTSNTDNSIDIMDSQLAIFEAINSTNKKIEELSEKLDKLTNFALEIMDGQLASFEETKKS